MDEDTLVRVVTLFAALDSIDYYTLLGLPRLYDRDELREAYYRFAGSTHPDTFRDEEPELRKQAYAVFKRAAEAYRVLGDPQLKVRYDEGLARGEVRLSVDEVSSARLSIPTEPTFQSLTGKQMWRQALEAEQAGDLKRARLQLTLVLAQERDNVLVQEKLAAIEEQIRGQRGGQK